MKNSPYSQHSSECSWWRVWASHWCAPKQSATSVSGRSPTGSLLPRSTFHLPASLKHNTQTQRQTMVIIWEDYTSSLVSYLSGINSVSYQTVSARPVHHTSLQPDPSQWFSLPLEHHWSSQSTPTWAEWKQAFQLESTSLFCNKNSNML